MALNQVDFKFVLNIQWHASVSQNTTSHDAQNLICHCLLTAAVCPAKTKFPFNSTHSTQNLTPEYNFTTRRQNTKFPGRGLVSLDLQCLSLLYIQPIAYADGISCGIRSSLKSLSMTECALHYQTRTLQNYFMPYTELNWLQNSVVFSPWSLTHIN